MNLLCIIICIRIISIEAMDGYLQYDTKRNVFTSVEQLGTTINTQWTKMNKNMHNDDDEDDRSSLPRALFGRDPEDKGSREMVNSTRLENDTVEPLTVPFAIVIDNAAYQKFDQNSSKIHEFCIQLVNYMNSLFSKLYVKIVLTDVLIWNEKDSFEISSDINKAMMAFDEYNRDILLPKSKHIHAQLITGRDFPDAKENKIIDQTRLNTICTDRSSSAARLASTSNVELQALFSTHELAHSLNIGHTGTNCTTCIMAPNVYESPELRNQWTVGNIKDFSRIIENKTCLFVKETDVEEFVTNTCGNGVVDLQEDCDIGQRDLHNSSCCDAWTCQYLMNQDTADVSLLQDVLKETINHRQSILNVGDEGHDYRKRRSHESNNYAPSLCNRHSVEKQTPPPKKPLTATLLLVVDHAAYLMFGQNTTRINNFCIELVEQVNLHLSQLFLKIVLKDILIWHEKDSFQISHNAVSTMNNFELYNKNSLLKNSDHNHAQLLTGQHQLDEKNRLNLGRARLNTICTAGSSSVVMLHDKANISLQATTNAHEIAHAFNMKHSDSDCAECIMAPSAGLNHTGPEIWTAGNMVDFIRIVKTRDCLFAEQAEMFAPNRCGNGDLDFGEECDIGQRDKNNTECCVAWTCKRPANWDARQAKKCSLQERSHKLNIIKDFLGGIPVLVKIILMCVTVLASFTILSKYSLKYCSVRHSSDAIIEEDSFDKIFDGCWEQSSRSDLPIPRQSKENAMMKDVLLQKA